jgi:hypothetical protein|tara:strand:+ start:2339 stop:2494 length:156 start_codon:yes stop_codon:yes gene_type:complete
MKKQELIDTLVDTCHAWRKENAELTLRIAQLENDLVRWKKKVRKWRERATK